MSSGTSVLLPSGSPSSRQQVQNPSGRRPAKQLGHYIGRNPVLQWTDFQECLAGMVESGNLPLLPARHLQFGHISPGCPAGFHHFRKSCAKFHLTPFSQRDIVPPTNRRESVSRQACTTQRAAGGGNAAGMAVLNGLSRANRTRSAIRGAGGDSVTKSSV